jgi:hypothetical protein
MAQKCSDPSHPDNHRAGRGAAPARRRRGTLAPWPQSLAPLRRRPSEAAVTEVTGVTDLFLTSRAGRVDRRGTRCTSCLPGAMHQHLAKRRARAIDLTQSKISRRRTGEYVADEHADKTAASEQRIGDPARQDLRSHRSERHALRSSRLSPVEQYPPFGMPRATAVRLVTTVHKDRSGRPSLCGVLRHRARRECGTTIRARVLCMAGGVVHYQRLWLLASAAGRGWRSCG